MQVCGIYNIGVRDAFCGARGWQCVRGCNVRASGNVCGGGMIRGAYNIYCEVAQVHETEESAATRRRRSGHDAWHRF